jgi:hypothetical protein
VGTSEGNGRDREGEQEWERGVEHPASDQWDMGKSWGMRMGYTGKGGGPRRRALRDGSHPLRSKRAKPDGDEQVAPIAQRQAACPNVNVWAGGNPWGCLLAFT